MIPDDENWRLLTLPTTPNGKVKVHPTQGIQIRGIHYWSNVFRDPEIHKTYVEVRYDPFDAGIAYAYVRGQWVKCISEHYPVLKGRLEKEIWLATAQLQKRYSNHTKQLKIRAKKLAEFLATAEAEEVLLEQRLRDAQVTEVFQVIEGRLPSSFFESQSNLKEPTRDSTNDDQSPSLQSEEKLSINPNQLQLFDSY